MDAISLRFPLSFRVPEFQSSRVSMFQSSRFVRFSLLSGLWVVGF